jgi:hypothetical protein
MLEVGGRVSPGMILLEEGTNGVFFYCGGESWAFLEMRGLF